MPLHVVEGIGDPLGLLRDPLPVRKAALKLAADAGRGDSTYQDYDQRITEAAEAWLAERTREKSNKPWMLFVSLVCPHFPLMARPEWYDLYPEDKVPWPSMYSEAERPTHPYIKAIRESMIYDQGFDESKVRKALAAYFGMVSYLDNNVGRLIKALEDTGLADSTRVIYTSDHGDNLGTRGLWGKSTMYEESVGVPMMMAGPEVPIGVVCREPVSLVDAFPTILDCVGVDPVAADRLPGASLMDVVAGRTGSRTVMSEYHAAGAATAVFMIRLGSFKYVHYVGMPPQLFNLATDPQETRDLGQDPGYRGVIAEAEAALRRTVDPEAADRQARADQASKIAQLGGREAILARGAFGYSPVPGTKAAFTT
jgi:choline-sulfatase